MPRSLVRCLALLGFLAVSVIAARAAIGLEDHWHINFANPKDAGTKGKATWVPTDRVGLSPQGLGYNDVANFGMAGAIETDPCAIGLSWRPTTGAEVRLEVIWAKKIDRNDSLVADRSAFVRYSPDCKHWSTWQALRSEDPAKDENPCANIFTGEIVVPVVQQQEYRQRFNEYAKLDVPWASDEEAAVKWIVAKDPHFFENNLPFAGYIQFRLELSFPRNERITQLNADYNVLMSGLHIAPKDPNTQKGRDVPWRYKAD